MKSITLRYSILAGDALLALSAFVLAIAVRYAGTNDSQSFAQHFQTYFLVVSVVVVAWPLLYFDMNLDGFRGEWQVSAILSKVVVAVSLLMALILALAFLTHQVYSRLVLLYFAILFAVELVGARFLIRFLVTSRVWNVEDHRCVILGNGTLARELANKIASHPELPFRVVGFLFPSDAEVANGSLSSVGMPVPSIKTLKVLELLAQKRVRKLVVAMSRPNGAEVRKLVVECRKASIQVYLVPQWYDLYVSNAKLEEIDGLPLLSLEERSRPRVNAPVKRAMDLVLSAGILLLVSPLLLLSALYVYGKKGRPFRAELRCGKDGIPFRMYRLNVERHPLSPKGYERFFVRWSLTELPQLWNVLRGDMSLVGPRPESAERLKYYSEWQRQRLKVRGGVTGLAQVHGLREQHPSEDKARFDLQYILDWSPFLDLSLILQTLWTLMFRGLSQEPSFGETTIHHGSSQSEFVCSETLDVNRS